MEVHPPPIEPQDPRLFSAPIKQVDVGPYFIDFGPGFGKAIHDVLRRRVRGRNGLESEIQFFYDDKRF